MTPYYEDDYCTIYHGDCRDVLPALSVGPCSVITDPPYAVRRTRVEPCVECGNDDAVVGWSTCSECMEFASPVAEFEMLGFLSPNAAEQATHSRGYADHDPDAFRELIGGFATAVARIMEPGGVLVAFGGTRTYHQLASAIESAGLRVHDLLVWSHDAGMPKAKTCLAPAHDPAVVATLGTPSLDFRAAPKWPSNVATFSRNREANAHLTPKPLSLMRWLVSTFASGVVIDPFMGSGTTLRAAKDLGRPSIGIEIDERYCEIAAKRLAQEVLDFGAMS